MYLINNYNKKGFSSNLNNDIEYYYKLCELQKWLREVHNIEVYVTPVKEIADNFKYYQWMIHTISFGLNNTYEEALEAGLIEGLKLITNNYGLHIL